VLWGVGVGVCVRVRACVCVCALARLRARVSACVCLCVCKVCVLCMSVVRACAWGASTHVSQRSSGARLLRQFHSIQCTKSIATRIL
jgi:hypothetical protein